MKWDALFSVRSRAIRMARESIGLPTAIWCAHYRTEDLELAAGYLKDAAMALQNELARREKRATDDMNRRLCEHRAAMTTNYTDPSMALCTHSLRPGVCPDC